MGSRSAFLRNLAEMKDYQRINVDHWQAQASDYVQAAERNWRTDSVAWGIWQIPNQELPLLPEDLSGSACLEIGCGAGYVSGWMAARGGDAVGIDPAPAQLCTAMRLESELKRGAKFVRGFAESLPFPDRSFDFVISEYGASLWADPHEWVPEAARVLRPGGRLVFMTCAALFQLCLKDVETDPLTTELQRPYLGMGRLDWGPPDSVEFTLPHGEWISLLTSQDFEIEALRELGASAGARSDYDWADPKWAASWPTEEVWMVRKRSAHGLAKRTTG